MPRTRFSRFIPALLAGTFLMAVAHAAIAQDQADDQSQDAQRRPRPAHSARPIDVDKLLQTMEDRMDLSGAQWDDVDAAVRDFDASMERQKEDAKATLEDQREQMRTLMQERVEARQSGDEEREREIMDKLRNLRPTDFRSELEETLIKNISDVLDDGQRRDFQKIVQAMRNPAMDPDRVKKNPSLLRRAVLQLELDQTQREKLDELFQNYWQDRREVSPSDREAMDNLALDFYDAVVDMLDEDQRQQLDSKMSGFAEPPAAVQRNRGQDEDRPEPDQND